MTRDDVTLEELRQRVTEIDRQLIALVGRAQGA